MKIPSMLRIPSLVCRYLQPVNLPSIMQIEEQRVRAVQGATDLGVQEQAARDRHTSTELREGALGASPLPGAQPLPILRGL